MRACICYLFAHCGFEQVLLLLLWRLLSALTGGTLWTLALPDRALLVGQAGGSVVFDGQLPRPVLPPAVAGLRRLEEVAALRSRFGGGAGRGGGADGQLMGGLGLDALGGRRGNGTLAHGLDRGGGRGGQGGVGGSCLGRHAHHLLLLLKIILRKKIKESF